MKRAGEDEADPSACKASRPLEPLWDAQPSSAPLGSLGSGGAPLPLQAPPPPPQGGPPPGGPPPPPPGGPPGATEGVSSAERLRLEAVEDEAWRALGGSCNTYISKLVHEHPREQCKVVIGPRGATISALREASGCAIKVADRTYASDHDRAQMQTSTQMQTVTYSGSEAQVQAAVRMVSELLTNGTLPAAAAAAAAPAAAVSGDDQQTTLQVSRSVSQSVSQLVSQSVSQYHAPSREHLDHK